MARHHSFGRASMGIRLVILVIVLSAIASAQDIAIEGIIKARSGATMIIQNSNSPDLVVLLTDATKVGQVQGVLKARRKQMSMAALIPGLTVKVEGSYNDQKALVAKSVSFKGNDLERAESIQAGMHETQERIERGKQELEKQSATLEAQKEALQQQQGLLTEQQGKIAANKAAIDAAVARFGQLDDYYIFDEVIVYFGNGKVALEPQYQPQLVTLAEKAKTIDAYMVQVIGYASSVGSASLNQRLSEDRADSVSNFLLQHCHIPLPNLLAPGAMGESQQVANDTAVDADKEAQNRRVVVRVLQNKGIAGLVR